MSGILTTNSALWLWASVVRELSQVWPFRCWSGNAQVRKFCSEILHSLYFSWLSTLTGLIIIMTADHHRACQLILFIRIMGFWFNFWVVSWSHCWGFFGDKLLWSTRYVHMYTHTKHVTLHLRWTWCAHYASCVNTALCTELGAVYDSPRWVAAAIVFHGVLI